MVSVRSEKNTIEQCLQYTFIFSYWPHLIPIYLNMLVIKVLIYMEILIQRNPRTFQLCYKITSQLRPKFVYER